MREEALKSADVEKGVGDLAHALMRLSQQHKGRDNKGGDDHGELGVKVSAVIQSLSSSLGAPLCEQLEKSVLGVLHDTPPSLNSPTSGSGATSSSSSSDGCSSQDKLEVCVN